MDGFEAQRDAELGLGLVTARLPPHFSASLLPFPLQRSLASSRSFSLHHPLTGYPSRSPASPCTSREPPLAVLCLHRSVRAQDVLLSLVSFLPMEPSCTHGSPGWLMPLFAPFCLSLTEEGLKNPWPPRMLFSLESSFASGCPVFPSCFNKTLVRSFGPLVPTVLLMNIIVAGADNNNPTLVC